MRRKIIVVILIIAAVFAVGIPGASAEGGVNGVIRVNISIGSQTTKSFYVDGNYTAEAGGSSIALERQLYTVKVSGSILKLYYGSKYLCSGTTIMLKQHTATEGRNNFIIMYNTLYSTSTKPAYLAYLGDMEFRINSDKIQAINHVYIEDYLYGVLPYEMNDLFPSQALRAQAVAARNYTAKRLGRSDNHDLHDESARDQVYRGYDPSKVNSIAAVDATAGQVLSYNGSIIDAFYSGSNGGRTELPYHRWGGGYEWKYYQIVDDPYDLANTHSLNETIFFPVVKDADHPITVSGNFKDRLPNDSNAVAYIKRRILTSGQLSSYGVDSVNDFELAGISELTGDNVESAGDLGLTGKPELEFNPDTADDYEYTEKTAVSDYSADSAGDSFSGSSVDSTGDFSFVGINSLSTNTYDAHGSQDHSRTPNTGVNNCLDKIRATGDFTVRVGDVNVVVTNVTLYLDYLSGASASTNDMYVAFSDVLGIFVVEPVYDAASTLTGYTISQRRFGHGCGLSQRGAQQRAESDDPEVNAYDKILAFYYPNTTLETRTYTRPSLTPVENPAEDYTNAAVVGKTMDVTSADSKLLCKLPVGARIQVVDPDPSDSRHKIVFGGADAYIAASGVRLDPKCTVTFETNEGDPKAPLSKYTASYISSAPAATKAGYTFEGWYSDAELTNKITFPYIVPGDITLYANWTITTYTVNYDLGGGRLAPGNDNPSSYTIKTPEFTLFNPARAGYKFSGWTGTGISGTAETVTVPAGSYGNRQYKANWSGIVPTLTSAVSTGYNSTSIAWSEAEGAIGYEVLRATSSGGTYSVISPAAFTDMAFADKGLKAGTTYYYKVRGLFSDGTDVVKGVLTAYKSVKPVPLPPETITATVKDYSSITVSWSSVPGASGYMVYRSTSENGTYSRITTIYSSTATSYKNTSLSTGTPYFYKVRAFRSSTSIYGSYSPVATAVTYLKPMENVAAATYYPTAIKISWKAVPGRTMYQVYRSETLDGEYKYLDHTTYTYYKDTGLAVGKWYYYKVRAYRTVGTKRVYNEKCEPVYDNTRVFQVKGVKAAMYSVTSNKITWSSVTGATGYEVMRCDAEGNVTHALTVTSNTYWYDKNLVPNQTYYYKVRAYRTVNSEKHYGLESDSPQNATPLFKNVTNVKAYMYSVTSNKITWNSVSGRTGYEVWWSETKDGEYTELTDSNEAYSYTYIYHRNLEGNGKPYYYKVVAYVTVNGKREYSAESEVTAYNKVNGIKGVMYAVNSNKISWSSVSGSYRYEIWRSDSAETEPVSWKETTDTYIYDKNIDITKTYYYKVRAYVLNSLGEKVYCDYSDTVSVVNKVTGAKAYSYSYSSNKITWNSVANRTNYELYRCDAEGNNLTEKPLKVTGYTYYINTGLTTGQTYYYKVRAYQTIGGVPVYSNYSDVVSAVPTLKSVSGAHASRYNSTKIKLTWNSASGATGYEVLRWNGVEYVPIKKTTLRYYYDGGLTHGTRYYYRIRAYRTVGENTYYGGWSNKAYATP